MELDLKNAIDESFGGGPAHRPMEDRLRGGRRAVRRRRALISGVVAAAMAITGPVAVRVAAQTQPQVAVGDRVEDRVGVVDDGLLGLAHEVTLEPLTAEQL